MICPHCGTEMIEGAMTIRGTFLRYLYVGWSWQSLWFCVDDPVTGRTRKAELMECGEERKGWICHRCHYSVLSGPLDDDMLARLRDTTSDVE